MAALLLQPPMYLTHLPLLLFYWRYIPKSGLAGSYANFVCFVEVTVFPGLSFNRIFCFPLLKIEKNEAEG